MLSCALVLERGQVTTQTVIVERCPAQRCFELTVTNFSDQNLMNVFESWINIVFLGVFIY